MFDLLYVIDSTITIVLKFVGIILIFKLIITKKNTTDINPSIISNIILSSPNHI